jgi:hypothetical protein
MPDDTTSSLPIACDLSVMGAAQRKRHRAVIERWRQKIQETVELTDGYAFRFEPDDALFLTLSEFITLERRCCPFLGFALALDPAGGPMWLRLTGRAGAKELIGAAFGSLDAAAYGGGHAIAQMGATIDG